MPATRPAARRLGAVLASVLLASSVAGCLQMATRPTPEPPATPTPSPTPPPAPTPTPGPPTPTPLPTFAMVTVRKNDNLNAIARRFATTARSIAYWNRDTYPSLDPDSPAYAPNRLVVGWVLRVQPGVVFTPTAAPEASDSGLDVTPVPTEYLGPPTDGPSDQPSNSVDPGASASPDPGSSAGG